MLYNIIIFVCITLYVCIYVCMYTFIHVCMYVYVCSIYVYMYLMTANKKLRTTRCRLSEEISEWDVCIKQVVITHNLSPNPYILSICRVYCITVLLPSFIPSVGHPFSLGFCTVSHICILFSRLNGLPVLDLI